MHDLCFKSIVEFAHVMLMSIAIVPELKAMAKLGIPDLPDSPNQPTSYSFPKNSSPQHDNIFQNLKDTLSGKDSPGIWVLCQTRWTVQADALASVTKN